MRSSRNCRRIPSETSFAWNAECFTCERLLMGQRLEEPRFDGAKARWIVVLYYQLQSLGAIAVAFSTSSPEAIYSALAHWDENSNWPPDAPAAIVILGGTALALYHTGRQRQTADIDAVHSSMLPDQLTQVVESLGISFELAVSPRFRAIGTSVGSGVLVRSSTSPSAGSTHTMGSSPNSGDDLDDAVAVARNLEPSILRDRVRHALPRSIGRQRNVHMAWADSVEEVNWPAEL